MLWRLLRAAFGGSARSDPLVERALALRAAGDLPAAEQLLRQAVAQFPDDAIAAANLGTVLLEQDRGQEGVALLQRALQCDPGCGAAHHNLANLLRVSGRLEEAIRSEEHTLNSSHRT